MSTPMYHVSASGEAVRCRAKIRCTLQHMDGAGKQDYDSLFGDVFGASPSARRRPLLAKQTQRSARAVMRLPGYDHAGYEAAAVKYVRRISEWDQRELRWYTENPGVNEYLRDPNLSHARGEVMKPGQLGFGVSDRIKGLDAAIGQGGFEKPLTVYRGVAVDDAGELQRQLLETYVPGRTVSFPQYLSTSVDPEVAVSFATGHGYRKLSDYQSVLFRLVTSEGAPVDAVTDSPIDREVLLPRNKRFRVRAVSRELVQNRTIDIDVFDAMNHAADTIHVGENLHGIVVIDLEEI